MPLPLLILAGLMVAAAIGAVGCRRPLYCALFLALTMSGLAVLYLGLHAQFLGFSQFLVYVGAVAILVVFAILLTGGAEPTRQPLLGSQPWVGFGIAGLVLCSLAFAILSSPTARPTDAPVPPPEVEQIGKALMTTHVLPLEALGVMLTVALIGAAILAMEERRS